MDPVIIPINLPMPFNATLVNAYLLKTGNGFFLIDTGYPNSRDVLESELDKNGCHPGDLILILLTHGDFDHTGNSIYIRQQFMSKIAMHNGDLGMLEHGDMFYNRTLNSSFLKRLMGALFRINAKKRGRPDIFLEDGELLSGYGLDAKVWNTPGHSTGSICILSSQGDLFCGDLFTNSWGKPILNKMLYDRAAGISSLEKLKGMAIKKVYPGHGAPFNWDTFLTA